MIAEDLVKELGATVDNMSVKVEGLGAIYEAEQLDRPCHDVERTKFCADRGKEHQTSSPGVFSGCGGAYVAAHLSDGKSPVLEQGALTRQEKEIAFDAAMAKPTNRCRRVWQCQAE